MGKLTDENGAWKRSRIESLLEARSFFSNDGKLDREIWVTVHFLRRTNIDFDESEIVAAEEPADTAFRNARFQIKELVPPGRHRQAEYEEKLDKATTAQDYSDLTEEYTPGEITFPGIVESCKAYETGLVECNKYGVREISTTDLLFYFNHPGVFEVPPESFVFNDSLFRSVSVLSNRYASVLCASADASDFLIANFGLVHDYRET